LPRKTKKKTHSQSSLSAENADRVCTFFREILRHSKGQHAGKAFDLLPWQEAMLTELFGRIRPDGTRQYRTAYIEVPKKNGKSTTLAGIALYMLLADREPGAEVYGAASDREQAGIIYREAAAMVRASPLLSSRLEVIDSRKTILYRKTNSFYRVLSADAFRAEGLNIHALLFDELHAQRDRRLWDALRYGGAARRQPLLLSITTAGYDRKSICWEQHAYAERCIADPEFDPSFYGLIYAASPEDDPFKEATWRKANPSLGHTMSIESFQADAREAEQSPAKLNAFLRYRLNIWTASDVRFLKPSAWAACSQPLQEMKGRVCYAGLDLASTTDLSACVVISSDEEGVVDVLPVFWCPSESIEQRSLRDKVDYVGWARDGFIRVTDGNVADYATIQRDILELCESYQIKQIGVDPWNATMLSQNLAGEGVDVVNVRQSYGSLSSPTKALEALVLGSKLRHAGHPVLSWMADNVAVQGDHQGNIKASKAKSTERIDGIAALINALAVQAVATAPPPEQDWNIVSL
jgi:phage terminase large subunit-like protein